MPRYYREIPQNRFWATARVGLTPLAFSENAQAFLSQSQS